MSSQDQKKIGVLSALRGLFLDARRTFSFASSATGPACLDLTRVGLARWPARGLVRLVPAQIYANRLNIGMYAR